MIRLAAVFAIFAGTACFMQAQQNCPLPPALQTLSSEENLFSEAQEGDLGDAIAETIALHVTIIENDQLTAHLQQLGQRLVEHLPATQMKFRFYLIDLPEVNAFSIAGGRVYISRKIVAFAHSDDELAGVLAHELGHIVTHQSAMAITRGFREDLGVTAVGDREDIFRKYHQYLEAAARRKRGSWRQEERHQIVADQVSIYALARAGFSVQSFPDFWDRLTELHGQSGNFVTDLFGSTTPEQHRLREMIKNSSTLPPSCLDGRSAGDSSQFRSWQQAVVDYVDSRHAESLPGLLLKRRFSQRLRSDISNLRFSPDGKYILAQDDGGINVVTRDPLGFLFYIPVPDAREAHFTPDSTSVVFSTGSMRAEKWSLSQQQRQSVHELTVRGSCLQTQLSPDGNVLACLNSEFALLLVDVPSSNVILEKKYFFKPTLFDVFQLLSLSSQDEDDGDAEFVQMRFSPDSRYFVAAHGVPHMDRVGPDPNSALNLVTTDAVIYDVASQRERSVPGSIREILPLTFTFLGDDKIVGTNSLNPKKSHILRFPSGEKIADLELWHGLTIRGATHGDSLLTGPTPNHPLAIVDVGSKNGWIGIKQRTADVYDGMFVTERLNGELALHTKDGSLISSLQLPESNLGKLVAGAASSDLTYVAISSRSRGVLWNVERDVRDFQTRRFNGVGFDGKLAYADFPKFEGVKRQIAQLHLDSGSNGGRELNEDVAEQQGLYLIITKPHKDSSMGRSNADVQVQDIRTGKLLWTRYFPKDLPSMEFDPSHATALMRWRISEPGALEELRKFPELKSHASSNEYLCQVVDANQGSISATFVIKSSIPLSHGKATHEWAVMQGGEDLLLTFALPSGEEKGHFFGQHPALSSSGLMAADTAAREVTVYDLRASKAQQQYRFFAPVVLKSFSDDGKHLLVLTGDQTAYVLDTATNFSPDAALASASKN